MVTDTDSSDGSDTMTRAVDIYHAIGLRLRIHNDLDHRVIFASRSVVGSFPFRPPRSARASHPQTHFAKNAVGRRGIFFNPSLV